VTKTPDDLADKMAALEAALVAEREKCVAKEARAARVEAELAVAKAHGLSAARGRVAGLRSRSAARLGMIGVSGSQRSSGRNERDQRNP
jgi:hypothetical protein